MSITPNENIAAHLPLVCKSGKFTLGIGASLKLMRQGKCKLLILADNCPPSKRAQLEYYAMLSNTAIHRFGGNNVDLGSACGKFFRASCMSVTDFGDADLSLSREGGIGRKGVKL